MVAFVVDSKILDLVACTLHYTIYLELINLISIDLLQPCQQLLRIAQPSLYRNTAVTKGVADNCLEAFLSVLNFNILQPGRPG